MIFLILKIFVYLALALLLGGAAGWLLRNFAAQQREEQAQRDLSDSRSKVPQLESQIRARDEKIRQLTREREEPPEVQGSRVQDEQLAHKLREKELEIQRLKGQLAEAQAAAADGLIAGEALIEAERSDPSDTGLEDNVSDALLASLHKQIEQQKEELAAARIQLELVGTQQDYQREAEELSQRLRQRATEQERLQDAVSREQNRVRELERERELQAKSLKVLHQQLELARESTLEARSS
ncbi:MAG: hypothetical protein AAGG11_23305 [Pseudomonadota bacterium]